MDDLYKQPHMILLEEREWTQELRDKTMGDKLMFNPNYDIHIIYRLLLGSFNRRFDESEREKVILKL